MNATTEIASCRDGQVPQPLGSKKCLVDFEICPGEGQFLAILRRAHSAHLVG